MKKVAIEKELSSIGNYLEKSGYDVQQLNSNMKYNPDELDKFDAVVLSGMREDVTGMQDTLSSVTVINAEGMTREQIMDQINKAPSKG